MTAEESIALDTQDARGERLDRFLARRLPQYSRARLQRWIVLGAVECDERLLSASTRLSGLERLRVVPQPLEAEHAFQPEPIPLAIRHTDDSVFVIAKPAGLVVHPAAGNWSGTLLNGLLHHDPGLARLPRAGIVHRLDKDTSGLMVVARNERAREALSAQLADRSLSRVYRALCHGRFEHATEIDSPIGRDGFNRLRMAVRADGRPAQTQVSPLAHGFLEGREVSWVECRLRTGRTHQIRVHMAAAGHPLVGDRTYGGGSPTGFARQALHAFRLAFVHPAHGHGGPFEEPLPADILALLDAAGIRPEPAAQIGAVR